MARFVKAAETEVSVEKSQQAIIGLLQRYGARDFGFDQDPDTDVATVRFRVKGTSGLFPVELVVHIDRVYAALYGEKSAARRGFHTRSEAEQARARANWRDQARRTAWRLLVDWLDAALSTTSLGVQTVEEVFLAHAVLPTADGGTGRVIDYITAAMLAKGGLPALMPGRVEG
jgi:hypothetical protein